MKIYFSKQKHAVFLVLITIWASCGPGTNVSEYQRIFPVKAYFKKETAKLSGMDLKLQKSVWYSDSSETQILENPDWNKELKPFLELDLDKPSVATSYDSTRHEYQNGHTLVYTARDNHPRVREIYIHFTGDIADTISFISGVSNMYYHSVDTLSYFGDGNFRLSSFNKPRIGKEIKLRVTGSTVKKK